MKSKRVCESSECEFFCKFTVKASKCQCKIEFMESIGTTSVWKCRPGIFNLSFVIYQCVRNRISGMFEWKLEMHRKSNVYSDESVFPFRYTRFSL